MKFKGSGTAEKTAVVGTRERNGRVKAKTVLSIGARAMEQLAFENIEKGATVHTDELHAYHRLGKSYKHQTVNHANGQYSNNGVTTNGIESVFAVLRRGLHGVYHKAGQKHIGRYIDEFAWRLNDGNVKRHTWERLDSFIGAVTGRQITYKELIADNGKDTEAQPF